jgi:hypothetical protein
VGVEALARPLRHILSAVEPQVPALARRCQQRLVLALAHRVHPFDDVALDVDAVEHGLALGTRGY